MCQIYTAAITPSVTGSAFKRRSSLFLGQCGLSADCFALTVAVSRYFFDFFHESNPSGLLIKSLKCFFLKIRFRGDIREICESTHVTAGSQKIYFSKKQNWLALGRDRLCAGKHCAESNSAQANTARSQTNLFGLHQQGIWALS